MGGRPQKVELAANWRARPPILMDIGPVLHADDVAAGKMSALYTRAEPRDFLDIDAAVFAMLDRYPDRRFAAYGASTTQIQALRDRFKARRTELLNEAS